MVNGRFEWIIDGETQETGTDMGESGGILADGNGQFSARKILHSPIKVMTQTTNAMITMPCTIVLFVKSPNIDKSEGCFCERRAQKHPFNYCENATNSLFRLGTLPQFQRQRD
jgi:hypothetical protein